MQSYSARLFDIQGQAPVNWLSFFPSSSYLPPPPVFNKKMFDGLELEKILASAINF
jgi:hypothetical protein